MLRAVEIWILDVITALHFWRDLDVVCAEGKNSCGVDLAFLCKVLEEAVDRIPCHKLLSR